MNHRLTAIDLSPNYFYFHLLSEIMFGLVGSDTFYAYANNGPLVIRVGIAMMSLSSTSVGLRFLARILARQPLLSDDWWILVALPWAWALCIAQFVCKLQLPVSSVISLLNLQVSGDFRWIGPTHNL